MSEQSPIAERRDWPDAPALLYIGTDGQTCQIDSDRLDLSALSEREKAICVALLEHSLLRLKESGNV